jgi:succinate dehydrogenase hydrophobic anchor subunit
MILDTVGDLRQLRNERSDWLLTVLTGVLILLIFVFAPLHVVSFGPNASRAAATSSNANQSFKLTAVRRYRG